MNGERAKKRSKVGKQWWSKRPLSGHSVNRKSMKFFKKVVHKIERKMAITLINEGERDFEDRYCDWDYAEY